MSVIVKSGVAGKVPTTAQLEYGQLALNYADQKMYFKNSNNTLARVPVLTYTSATNNYNMDLGAVRYIPWNNSGFNSIQFGHTHFYSSNLDAVNGAGWATNAYYTDGVWKYLTGTGAPCVISCNQGFSVRWAAAGTVDAAIPWTIIATTSATTGQLIFGGGSIAGSASAAVTLANGVATLEQSGYTKTVETTRVIATASNVQVDVSNGSDGSSYVTEITIGAYLGKWLRYQHHVYKTNTWTDYGPSVMHNQASAGITVTYAGGSSVGNLRYTVSGLASASVVLVTVKATAGNAGGAVNSPTITITSS